MALKTAKATTPPESVAQRAAPNFADLDLESAIATDINLEDAIADQLLDSIDWAKVRSALIKKAPAKLFAWLTSSSDTPINISAFPELSALPSNQDGEAA